MRPHFRVNLVLARPDWLDKGLYDSKLGLLRGL
jgi:hypothetical protein